MTPKPYQSTAVRLFKGLVILEVVGVIGAYSLYRKMNTSQDFRNSMNRVLPSVLEVYYKANESAGVYGIRERDMIAWSTKE